VVKLFAVLGVIVVALGGGDLVARHWAEGQLAGRIETSLPGSHATVRISSFPFVGRLAASGSVHRITAHVDRVSKVGLTFAFVDVEVDGVKLDRTSLLRDRKVHLQGISRGVVRAEITDAALSAALGGVPLQLGDNSAQVTVNGVRLQVAVSVKDNKLLLQAAGIGALSVSIPKLSILPCAASATVRPGRIDVSCEIHEIPPALLSAA
jgi:hypothetical protein